MIAEHDALVRQLAAAGELPDDWRAPFEAVARDLFIPGAIWDGDEPILREEDPDAWLALVYSDSFVVTQLDDGATRPGEVGRYYSSSSSMPSVMARMLRQLQVGDGDRVLEIGTGTGWNAGLLAYRLGGADVTSIEIDPAVAERARHRLATAALTPTVVCGDGADGYAAAAPYDRVLATCSVRHVPYAWVEQTRPGGLIVTPWGTPYYNGAMLRLTVTRDGEASGPMVGTSAFMWLRDQRTPVDYLDRVRPGTGPVPAASGTDLHPYEPISEPGAAFMIGVLVAGCQNVVVHDDDGDPDHYALWLMDPASRSWAQFTHEPGADRPFPVRQRGSRRLWDEVEAAFARWETSGRPDITRFGLTVTPDRQYVWLDSPDNPLCPAAAPPLGGAPGADPGFGPLAGPGFGHGAARRG